MVSRSARLASIILLGLASLAVAAFMLFPMANRTTDGQDSPEPRQVAVEGGSYTDVTPAGLAGMLEEKGFPLVNVHIPYEGEIEGTDLFIPFNAIGAHLDELPADPNSKVVLYCRSGPMSAIAARELVSRGYTNVWNLAGGMVAWEEAGYPLIELGR